MNFETIDVDFEVLESVQETKGFVDGIFREIDYNSFEEQTILNRILQVFNAFKGWTIDAIKQVTTQNSNIVQSAWAVFSQFVRRLLVFDWGSSDQDLQNQIAAIGASLAAVTGDFVGAGLVRLVSLTIAGGLTVKYPVVAGKIFADLLEDTSGEFRARVAGLLYTMAYAAAEATFSGQALAGRWFLRRLGVDIPTGSDRVTDQPASFYSVLERVSEGTRNRYAQQFLENLFDAVIDELFEVGFIIAGSFDELLRVQRASGNAQVLGEERKIKITPDEEVPSEQIVLSGPQDLVVQNLETISANHFLLWNRDIGALVGEPIEETILRRPQSLRITINYRSEKTPPWVDQDGRRSQSVTYTIPSVKRSALDWGTIKAAAGGSNGYTWGPFKANAILSGGSMMRVYGASPASAEQRLRSLLTLSDEVIATLNISEEKIEGTKAANPSLIKRPKQVYPAFFSIYNRGDLLDSANSNQARIQSRSSARARIPLWVREEPADAKRIINDLLLRGKVRAGT